jgi:hypothetical protein
VETLKTELFERPFYVLFFLAFLEVALIGWWRHRRTGALAAALAVGPLLAVAVLLTARLVVTDRETMQQAVEDMVADANRHSTAAIEKHLAREVQWSLREGAEATPTRRQEALLQVGQAMEVFDVHSVKTVDCKVDSPHPRAARMRLLIDVGYRHGGLSGTVRMEWTIRWVLRDARWQIDEVRPTGGSAGVGGR